MLSAELHEAATDFGRALLHAPALVAYRNALAALEADPGARQLLDDLRDRQLALARVQRTGLAASQEQIAALRVCQDSVRANGTIMVHLRTANELKAFLPAVAVEVSAALGTDYAALVAPTSC